MNAVKMILFIALFPMANRQVFSQQTESHDKIKSIIVMEEKNDVLVKKQYKESETYFDVQGNVIEEIKYDQGKVSKHFRYQYDSAGNKIKEEELDSSGKIKESSEYKFENGLRVEKIVYDQNRKIRSRKTYTYTKF
jgi:hypothetical protein